MTEKPGRALRVMACAASASFLAFTASAEPQSVDVSVHGPATPPKCNAIDAYYFGCALARSAAASRQQAERQQVGQLMADGKCDEASKVALRAADFDMAAKVKSLCTPAAEAAPAKTAEPPPA